MVPVYSCVDCLSGFDDTAAVQTARAVSTINWSYLLTYVIPGFIMPALIYFLKVEADNKKLREMKEE